MSLLQVPQGDFELERIPDTPNLTLRAWDAADEYLLNHLAESADTLPEKGWAILNDGFGALAVALADRRPRWLSDSHTSRRAAEQNLLRNGKSTTDIGWVDEISIREEARGFGDPVELVLIKVPKTLSLLEDQLHRLRPHLRPGARILGAGMTKTIHNSTLDLFTHLLGPTTTSLARKKARLIFCEFDAALDAGVSPYPTSFDLPSGPETPAGLRVVNHAGVFSQQRLDGGTRLLLEAMRHIDMLHTDLGSAEALEVVDLGCGNGVVGTVAAQLNPNAHVTFLDESKRAVASARETFAGTFGGAVSAEFHVADCLDGVEPDSIDLILNNPPFHQQQAVGDAVAWKMFTESRRALRPGGALFVVGNRHLGYHVKLNRIFGNCEVVASNEKFVVLRAGYGPSAAARPRSRGPRHPEGEHG